MKTSKLLKWYKDQIKQGLTKKEIIKKFDKLIKNEKAKRKTKNSK